MVDLLDQISWGTLECLNEKPDHPIGNALKQGFREDGGLYLESDTDEQLLIHIPFSSAVKINSVIIQSKNKPEQAPRSVKLFVNRPTIGFSEAADTAGQADFELTPAQAAGEPIPLKLVKFQRVSVLTIFVADNVGDTESTVIEKLAILGSAGDSFNVAEIKDVSKEQG
ncbi:PIT1 [Auxenochlorella protothecoides x Auxenochlorella symbiontica]